MILNKYFWNAIIIGLIFLAILNAFYVWNTPYFWRDVIFGGISSFIGIIAIFEENKIKKDTEAKKK